MRLAWKQHLIRQCCFSFPVSSFHSPTPPSSLQCSPTVPGASSSLTSRLYRWKKMTNNTPVSHQLSSGPRTSLYSCSRCSLCCSTDGDQKYVNLHPCTEGANQRAGKTLRKRSSWGLPCRFFMSQGACYKNAANCWLDEKLSLPTWCARRRLWCQLSAAAASSTYKVCARQPPQQVLLASLPYQVTSRHGLIHVNLWNALQPWQNFGVSPWKKAAGGSWCTQETSGSLILLYSQVRQILEAAYSIAIVCQPPVRLCTAVGLR